ncbi:hybrid non-ribosomal peptide synthetase/type I polyketide synthase [Streptomyces sp. TS71-3]|uniref:non-ribosomal peptide synthetase/type I polyketide synthase n=1 Tax=Streptomyces sp. TS71-3 TaxID=2733862 RepID=UPI001B0448AA|nr:hybrid non-ribosomal peptide synthetase/type I polyketide synthase [Streptomyces sp. TS71-3]GHJ39082.1 hypothetical protein Sm713_46910 [Streptomyces sp. TS71-3]
MTDSLSAASSDRIAIIGIGCRFPGRARDHRTFWRNLIDGRDCLTPTPPDRYDVTTLGSRDRDRPGRLVGGRGGYIDGFDEFDPAFFGISPREAGHMDPQQRKLLEVSWEALEDGGQRPAELAGTRVGVYIGAFTLDYKILQFSDLGFESLAAHTATGTMMAILANRISHCFDFRGPSMSLDTACSGSLVAVHLARQSLLRGESELALAGGVMLHMAPQYTIAETKGGFLSADGRSRTFDAAADGYVRAEGVGVVVLKRLADALRDGDPIHAVVAGTGVNQDGRTNGITVPNADAQVTLVERVCAEAGITPGDLQYVEAHGTSTPVGDRIEAATLGQALAIGRKPGATCYVGSVKTNIGHAESAAGIAGLIKTALALKHRRIPPHINLERLSPAIDEDQPYEIPTQAVDWPEHDGPARAGVNSFGFGGTNAHVLLEEAPPRRPLAEAERKPAPTVLPLSAKDPALFPELAAGIRRELAGADGPPVSLDDLGHTLAHRRQHHEHRMSVVYSSRQTLDEALAAFERGEAHPGVLTGRRREPRHRKLAWVFTGMGPQWWGMGRGLFETEPVFREAVLRCDREIRRQAGWSLADELAADEADSRMAETWLAQPANFAVQVGLAALWRSRGIRPDAIVGHSTGEAAAFHEAGVYSLADAVRIVLHRSRLQQKLAGTGTMLAVGLPEAEAERRILPHRDRVSVAAANSPSSTTLSGDPEVLREIADRLGEEQVFARFLTVQVPYHSVRMDEIKDELLAALAGLAPRPAEVPLYLTAQEGTAHGTELDAAYWWRNVRDQVRFRSAVDALARDGYGVFLEIGPHPVLAHAIRECLQEDGAPGADPGTAPAAEALDGRPKSLVLPSIRRGEDEPERFTRSLAALHNAGVHVDWDVLQPTGGPVALPPYPFRRERHWVEPAPVRQVRLGLLDHPLLGRRTAHTHPTWESRLDLERLPYLADHRIQGNVVFPAAGYLEMAAQAVRSLTGGEATLAGIELHRALFLPEGASPTVQLTLDPTSARFTVATPGEPGTVHVTGAVHAEQRRSPGEPLDAAAVRARSHRHVKRADCYAALAGPGYQYGPAFQGIEEVWIGEGEALARIHPQALPAEDAADSHVHPVLLDACLQTLLATRLPEPAGPDGDAGPAGGMRLPVSIQEVRLLPAGEGPLWAHATVVRDDSGELTGDIALYTDDGAPLGRVTGCTAVDVEHAAGSVGQDTIDGWLAEPVWTQLPPAEDAAAPPTALLVLADRGGVGDALAELARSRGARCHLVRHGTAYAHDKDGSTVRPGRAEDLRRLFAELDTHVDTVAHLWNLDLPPLDAAAHGDLGEHAGLGAWSLVCLAQVLPSACPGARLHIVTRGAQAAAGQDRVEPLGASAWGVGRVLWQQELTAHRGKLIDLPSGDADGGGARAAEAEALLREMSGTEAAGAPGEEEIALRGGQRYTCRLRRPEGLSRPLPLRLRPDGSYLVTGAFGALGRLLCRTLVSRGARRLILAGRTGLPPRELWATTDPATPAGQRIAFVRELEAMGAQALPAALDITDEAAFSGWLAGHRRRGLPPVRGVFHLAGQVRDATVPEMDRAAFDDAYGPKAAGGLLLHRLLRDEPLDHFVLFSSVASLLTTAGQTNYAAGNAFLDALAHHRRARGLPALSLDWGPWATGMIEELGLVEHYRTARGMSSLTPGAGMAVLERVIGQHPAQLLVATIIDWPVFLAWYPAPPPLVAELAAGREDRPAEDADGFLARLTAAGEGTRRQLLTERFSTLIADVMGIGAGRIGPADELGAHGLDSLLAMELRARVHADLGVALPVVALLGNASVDTLVTKLSDGLGAHLRSGVGEGGAPDSGSAPVPEHTDERCYPLTHNQKALWFLKQLNPDAFAYNIGGAVEVRTVLDPELLFAAFRTLVERHPALRASFVLQDGGPVQRISPDTRGETRLFDVEGRPWEEVHGMIVREYRRPYDLATDPLVRLHLFRRGPDRWVIMKGVHHIVSDAISTFTFIEELFALYEGMRQGRPAELPPVRARYLDFLNWQNAFLAGPDAERMLSYWREHLPAELPVLALPTDKPRPPVQTHNGASEFFRLDAELSARVHALAREHNVTVFVVLLSAYYLLLHRYSGQDDIVVGSPVTGRTQEEFAGTYGYFVNPLPLHVSLADAPTAADLLQRVRGAVLGGLDNQEYPFVLLVEKLGLRHDPSRSAVFQAMFILLAHKVSTEQYGYRLDYIELPEEEGQFDLTLSAYEDRADGCFHCVFKYNSDLFVPRTVRRMSAHYVRLLDALTRTAPGRPVGALRMLDAAERGLILDEWSGAGRQSPPGPAAHELIRRAAAACPDAVAVSAPSASGSSRTLTYGELERDSRRAARALRQLGAGKGATVAVCLEKSPELISVLLAVWRTGAAYLPLDPEHPADRLAHLTRNAGATLIVTAPGTPAPPGTTASVVTLDHLLGTPDPGAGTACPAVPHPRREQAAQDPHGEDPYDEEPYGEDPHGEEPDGEAPHDEAARGALPDPDAEVSPDDTAYVVHTSGSTGRPKAVRISHRSLASAYQAWRAAYRLDDDVRVHLQMAGAAFDVFTGDLVRALCSGGTLVLVGRDLLFDTARLHRTMVSERVDCGEFVPAVARALVGHCEERGARLDFLRLLVVGSDTWNAAEHRRLRALCGAGTRLVNSYGLTEATIDSTWYEGPVDALEPGRTVPIGRPFAGSTVYVLDERGEPVPPGVRGELWIGGAGLADGYAGDPEQTAERFVDRIFDGPGAGTGPLRLYRTGDLACWDGDGVLHLLGRGDSQVKVAGHRIETGEIEALLVQHPDVAQAAVTVRRSELLGAEGVLCAYCVPAPGAGAQPRELRRHLAESLPSFMVPAYFTEVPALPLTSNGKVDAAALPAPVYDPGGDAHEPPVTLYEQRMAAHWEELLGLTRAGLDDDFFVAGGSSVKLIELIHRLRTEFGIDVPVSLLFRVTTLRGMARTVEHVVTGRIAGTQPYLVFNTEAGESRAVFCFPPAGGHGLVHRQLAAHLPEHRLIAFNHLPGDDKVARYADHVADLTGDAPCTLFGYSLGGNLAFEVAKELERRGLTVSGVIIVDSFRAREAYPLDAEAVAAFEDELREHLRRHTGSETVAEETMQQAREYLDFSSRTPNLGTVAAPLTVISDEDKLPLYEEGRRGSWHGASTGRTVLLRGHGPHAEMLDGDHALRNANLLRSVLTEDVAHAGA